MAQVICRLIKHTIFGFIGYKRGQFLFISVLLGYPNVQFEYPNDFARYHSNLFGYSFFLFGYPNVQFGYPNEFARYHSNLFGYSFFLFGYPREAFGYSNWKKKDLNSDFPIY